MYFFKHLFTRLAGVASLLLLCSAVASATNYYLSSRGNNSNSGTAPTQAWKSITRLNEAFGNVLPGDTVFFERGAKFYGSIKIIRSGMPGKPIVFTAYGTGSDPVITGFTEIKGWTEKADGIWQAPAPGVQPNVDLVMIDGLLQQVGRYPNAGDADGGYLRYEDFTARSSITDKELNDAIDWTGAEVVIRKNHWTLERCRVTRKEGHTLFYTYANAGINPIASPTLYPGIKGNGYFFQKDARTLDQDGEWFFDSTTGNLQLFLSRSQPGARQIKASTIDTLVNSGNMSYISFIQLSFEGANRSAVFNRDGDHISIQYCRFTNIGARAVHCWNTGNVLITHSSFNHVLSNAIQVRNGKKDNVTVRNCQVKNTGAFAGMGSFFDDRDYKAISVTVRNNVLVENNTVDSTGLTAIQFQGSNATVQHNRINYFCLVADDGAGIYTYVDASKDNPGADFVNRVVRENIILNGKGAAAGSVSRAKAEGIYLDGGSMNVLVEKNTIAHVVNKALACNNPWNVTLRNNTCFNNGGGWGAARVNTWQQFGNLIVTNNIFYSLYDDQSHVNFIYAGLDTPGQPSIWEAMQLAGTIDSNYYHTVNPLGFHYIFSPAADKPFIYPSPLTGGQWQALTGHDLHSTITSGDIPTYKVEQKLGDNLVSNGAFTKDITGVSAFGGDTKLKWDQGGVLTDQGSLKIEISRAQPNRFALISGAAGLVQKGKKYLFRFQTLGNSDCGILKAYIRKAASPYTTFSAAQTSTFGTLKQQHEFLFVAAETGEAAYVVEIEKDFCTTYLDEVELHEAAAVVYDPLDFVRLEYNDADKAVELPLDKKYVGVDGTTYSDRIVLPPFSSKLLIAAPVAGN